MAVIQEPGTRPRTTVAFSSRDFRLLWGGQTISFLGDAAFVVALGWRVTELTGKASSLGLVFAIESAGTLLTLLLGGVLADRYSRRGLMIGSDLSRAAVATVFCVMDTSGHLTLTSVFVLAACFGLADGFFQPAFGGIVPLVVDMPMLASANSWLAIGRRGSAVVGPAVAAGIYGTAGPPVVWGLEALSFVVAAAAVVLARPRRALAAERLGVRRELAAGYRYVASVAWLWMGILAGAVVMTVTMAPFTSLLPALVRDHYDRGVGAYGLLFSAVAAGMVAGSLVWARWNPPRHRMVICFAALALNDLGIIVVALSDSYPVGMVGAIWRGFGIGLGASAWTTLLTELVPEHLLSRVFSFDSFGSHALTPVGFALAAAAATVWPVTTIVAVGGVLGFVLWFAPLLSRRVREAA